jgi:hypothetical protein
MPRVVALILLCLLLRADAPAQSCGNVINIPISTTWLIRGQASTLNNNGYGSMASQDLGVAPQQFQVVPPGPLTPGPYVDGIYSLKFSVQNSLPHYPGYYDIKISFGSQELCETDGWGLEAVSDVTFTCPSPRYIVTGQALPGGGPAQGSSNLLITVSIPDWPLLFSNISFTFTPTLSS